MTGKVKTYKIVKSLRRCNSKELLKISTVIDDIFKDHIRNNIKQKTFLAD